MTHTNQQVMNYVEGAEGKMRSVPVGLFNSSLQQYMAYRAVVWPGTYGQGDNSMTTAWGMYGQGDDGVTTVWGMYGQGDDGVGHVWT